MTTANLRINLTGTESAAKAVERLAQDFDNLGKEAKDTAGDLNRLEKEINQVDASAKKTSAGVTNLGSRFSVATKNSAGLVDSIGKLSPSMGATAGPLKNLLEGVSGLSRLSGPLIFSLGGVAAGLGAVAGGLALAASNGGPVAQEFEKMSGNASKFGSALMANLAQISDYIFENKVVMAVLRGVTDSLALLTGSLERNLSATNYATLKQKAHKEEIKETKTYVLDLKSAFEDYNRVLERNANLISTSLDIQLEDTESLEGKKQIIDGYLSQLKEQGVSFRSLTEANMAYNEAVARGKKADRERALQIQEWMRLWRQRKSLEEQGRNSQTKSTETTKEANKEAGELEKTLGVLGDTVSLMGARFASAFVNIPGVIEKAREKVKALRAVMPDATNTASDALLKTANKTLEKQQEEQEKKTKEFFEMQKAGWDMVKSAAVDATVNGLMMFSSALGESLGGGEKFKDAWKKVLGSLLQGLGATFASIGSAVILADPWSGGAPNPVKGGAMIAAGLAMTALGSAFGAQKKEKKDKEKTRAPSTNSQANVSNSYSIVNEFGITADPKGTARAFGNVLEDTRRYGTA